MWAYHETAIIEWITYGLDDNVARSSLAAQERISIGDGNLQALPQEADFMSKILDECVALSLLGNELLFFVFELLQDLGWCAEAAFSVSSNLLFKSSNWLDAKLVKEFVDILNKGLDEWKAKFLKEMRVSEIW